MKNKLANIIIKVLEAEDFNVSEVYEQNGEEYVEINQHTPLGEDWHETIWFDGTISGFIQAIRERYNHFDVEEEAEPYIEMRGKRGVPKSIKDLLNDAEWKEEKLHSLVTTFDDLSYMDDSRKAELFEGALDWILKHNEYASDEELNEIFEEIGFTEDEIIWRNDNALSEND